MLAQQFYRENIEILAKMEDFLSLSKITIWLSIDPFDWVIFQVTSAVSLSGSILSENYIWFSHPWALQPCFPINAGCSPNLIQVQTAQASLAWEAESRCSCWTLAASTTVWLCPCTSWCTPSASCTSTIGHWCWQDLDVRSVKISSKTFSYASSSTLYPCQWVSKS